MKKTLYQILRYGFIGTASFFSIFPFIWMIIGMTNTSTEITKGKMSFGPELVNNFNKLIELVSLPLIMWNSLKVAILTTLVSLIVTSMAGYGFQFFGSQYREKIFKFLLLAMMVPFAALMIPLFRLMAKFQLLNNHWAIILPMAGSIFLIFFFRQSFRTFPYAIIEAARIDGASEFGIFTGIVIPCMKSTYAAGAIYAFMMSWNNYLWPLIVLQTNDKQTMPIVISSLSSAYFPDFGVIMLLIVIATLPMLLVFFLMQKEFTQGMTGSIK